MTQESLASRRIYNKHIDTLEVSIKNAASDEDGLDEDFLNRSQLKLNSLADKYQSDTSIGSDVYKLYETQALIYYYQKNDSEALTFVDNAVEARGHSYAEAEDLRAELINNLNLPTTAPKYNDLPPLKLQALIRGQRTSAIIMAVISILSVWAIPWAIFYIYMAIKLDPREVPSRNLIKTAAIVTLPLCLAIIPIIIDIEFWNMNKYLKEYEEKGISAFTSDEDYVNAEPKRARGNRIVWGILVALILGGFVLFAIVSALSSSSNSSSYSSLMDDEAISPYVSSEHGFTVDFPGLPTAEHSNIDASGQSVPVTYYSKDHDGGNKVYALQVVNYPVDKFDFSGQERGVLDGAINGMARTTGATLLNSSNNETFSGYPSADASYTSVLEGQSYEMYTKTFLKGNDMYTFMTMGESFATFQTFVSSFKFN